MPSKSLKAKSSSARNLGGCPNVGPVLGTLNTRCRIILGTRKGTIILTTTHLNHDFIDDCARHLQPSNGRACLFTHHTSLPQLYPCDVDTQRKTAKDSPRHVRKLQLADAQQVTSSSTAKSRVPVLQPVNVPEGKVEPSGFKTPASSDLHVRMCQIMVAFLSSLQ